MNISGFNSALYTAFALDTKVKQTAPDRLPGTDWHQSGGGHKPASFVGVNRFPEWEPRDGGGSNKPASLDVANLLPESAPYVGGGSNKPASFDGANPLPGLVAHQRSYVV